MDDPKDVSQQPATPPASEVTSIPSQKPVEQQPEQLTAEAVRRIAREEALRASQSLTDKAEARIKAHLETVKASGVQVTPEQESNLRATVTKQVMEEERGGTAATVPAPDQEIPLDPRVQLALDAMKTEGLDIIDGDPELPGLLDVINQPGVTPYQLATATKKAIDAKRTRTTSQAESAHLRTPAGGGESSPGTAASAHDLWKDAYKEK